MKVCITIDMDNYRDYRSLVDPSGDGVGPSFYLDAVPRFLDLLDRHGARATFFMIGQDGNRADHRRLVREIAARGHEVANHSFTHPYNFRRLSRMQKESEIARAEDTIADIVGARPVGFRAPSWEVDGETLEILQDRGYLYDSSIVPSPLMWAFMVYGKVFLRRSDYQLGSPAAVFAPPRPYVPRLDSVHRVRGSYGHSRILEIPLSIVPVLRIPFYSTFLRRLGPRIFSVLVRTYGRRQPVLHSLYHLIELADFSGTSLGPALARLPGLALPFATGERFVMHATGTLASVGNAVTLRELAVGLLEARTAAPAIAS
jgi:hypothetical protein